MRQRRGGARARAGANAPLHAFNHLKKQEPSVCKREKKLDCAHAVLGLAPTYYYSYIGIMIYINCLLENECFTCVLSESRNTFFTLTVKIKQHTNKQKKKNVFVSGRLNTA